MTVELARAARSRIGRAAAWAVFVAFVLAIIGTQSRGAALGACAVFGFLWLTSKRKGAALLGIGLVAVLVAVFASDAYFNRMKTMSDYETEGSAKGRILAWKAGVRMAMDNPLLGVGAGHFPQAYGTKYRPPDAGSAGWLTAHSMYFLVLGELGFTGLVIYGALVFGAVRATLMVRRKVLQSARGPPLSQMLDTARLLGLLATSAIGFAVAGAFLSASYYPHVFILTGLLLAAREIALRSIRVSPQTAMQVSVASDKSRRPRSRATRARSGTIRSFRR